MTKQGTIHLGVIIPVELHALIKRVSWTRGELISSFVRRAILKELAVLGFLSDEQSKALGVEIHKANVEPLNRLNAGLEKAAQEEK